MKISLLKKEVFAECLHLLLVNHERLYRIAYLYTFQDVLQSSTQYVQSKGSCSKATTERLRRFVALKSTPSSVCVFLYFICSI